MRRQKGLQYGIVGLFAVTVACKWLLMSSDELWPLIAGLGLCFLPWTYEKVFKVKIAGSGQLVTLLFIFASQYLGSYLGFYGRFHWWDLALHFASGGLLAYWGVMVAMSLSRDGMLSKEENRKLLLFVALISACASAGLWEIIEFMGDTFLGTNAQLGSLTDTMTDIICGTIGGGLFTSYMGLMIKARKKLPFKPLVYGEETDKKEN